MLLIVAFSSPIDAQSPEEAWRLVDDLRRRLVADSPIGVEFTQTFTPSGFTTGDIENGTVSFDLPDCVRWDYIEPFPRSFLLCGDVAYIWNTGETSGRRYEIDHEEEEGLDLLRLDVSELQDRFVAEAETGQELLFVHLESRTGGSFIRNATVALSTDARRLLSVSYSDRDGNRTEFELGEPASLDSESAFEPPPLEWLEN